MLASPLRPPSVMPSRERSRPDDDRLHRDEGASDDDFDLPDGSALGERPLTEQRLVDEPLGTEPLEGPVGPGSYESVFGLDEVTEDDVALFLAEQDEEERQAEKKAGFLNVQTGAGLGLIGVGALYLMQLAGIAPLGFDPGFISALPVLAGILIVLTGFGVLDQNRGKKRRQRKKAAARKKKVQKAAKQIAREQRRQSGGRRSRTRPLGGSPAERSTETAREARRRERITTTRTESRTAQTTSKRRTRLAKSSADRKLFGVAGGLGQFFNIDPTLIRIAFVIGTVFSGGTVAIPLYILLALVLPSEDKASIQARLDDLDRRVFKEDD